MPLLKDIPEPITRIYVVTGIRFTNRGSAPFKTRTIKGALNMRNSRMLGPVRVRDIQVRNADDVKGYLCPEHVRAWLPDGTETTVSELRESLKPKFEDYVQEIRAAAQRGAWAEARSYAYWLGDEHDVTHWLRYVNDVHDRAIMSRFSEVYDIRALTGSVRQVAWAIELREAILRDWQDRGTACEVIADAVERCFTSCTSSKHWIDACAKYPSEDDLDEAVFKLLKHTGNADNRFLDMNQWEIYIEHFNYGEQE